MQKEFFTTEWVWLFSDDLFPVLKTSCIPFSQTYSKSLRSSKNPTHSKTNRPFRRFVFSLNRRLLFFTAEYTKGIVTQRTVVAWCLIVTITPRHFGCFVAIESAGYRTFDTGIPLAVKAAA